MRFLIVLLLAGCSSNAVQHEARSLLCLGFCSEQRVEHTTGSGSPPTPPKEKSNEANDKTP